MSVLTYPDHFERPAEQHVLGSHQGAHRVVMGLDHLDVLVVVHVPHLMATGNVVSKTSFSDKSPGKQNVLCKKEKWVCSLSP